MALKHDYAAEGAKHSFDKNSLSPGDVAFEVTGFREGADPTKPINLKLEVAWSSNEEDGQYIGRDFEYAVFLSGPNAGVTWRQLKDLAKAAGWDHSQWTEDNQMPLGNMIVGLLKLLAVERQMILCKIVAGKTDPKARFVNLVKILRTHPEYGTPLPNALPEPPTHELILNAMNAEAPGEKSGEGKGGSPW